MRRLWHDVKARRRIRIFWLSNAFAVFLNVWPAWSQGNVASRKPTPDYWPYDRWLPVDLCVQYNLCKNCTLCSLNTDDEWVSKLTLMVKNSLDGKKCLGLQQYALEELEPKPTVRMLRRPWFTSSVLAVKARMILHELLNVDATLVDYDGEDGVLISEPADQWWTSTEDAIRSNGVDVDMESWDLMRGVAWEKSGPEFTDLGRTGYRGQGGLFASTAFIKKFGDTCDETNPRAFVLCRNWTLEVSWFQWLRGSASFSVPPAVFDVIWQHAPKVGATRSALNLSDDDIKDEFVPLVCQQCSNECCTEVFLRAFVAPTGKGMEDAHLRSLMETWKLRIVLTYLDDERFRWIQAAGGWTSFLIWDWNPYGSGLQHLEPFTRIQFPYDGMLADTRGLSESFDWPAFALRKVVNRSLATKYPVLAMVLGKLTMAQPDMPTDIVRFLFLISSHLGNKFYFGDYTIHQHRRAIEKTAHCLDMTTDSGGVEFWATAIKGCKSLTNTVVDGDCTSECLAGEFLNHSNGCTLCPVGYYCPDETKVRKCPDLTSTSSRGRTTIDDCQCDKGKEIIMDGGKPRGCSTQDCLKCKNCPEGLYKESVDDARCRQRCPPNAEMIFSGASSSEYCSCKKGFYFASPERSDSERCKECPEGAVCDGGWDPGNDEKATKEIIQEGGLVRELHMPPQAAAGYHGNNLALPQTYSEDFLPRFDECAPLAHACQGKNICAEGTLGDRCLICKKSWVRGQSPVCEQCPTDGFNTFGMAVCLSLFLIAYIQAVRLIRYAATHFNVLSPIIMKIALGYFQNMNAVLVVTGIGEAMLDQPEMKNFATLVIRVSGLCTFGGAARKQMLCTTHTILKLCFYGRLKYEEIEDDEWELLVTRSFFICTAIAPVLLPIFFTLVCFAISLIYDCLRPHFRSKTLRKIKACRALLALVTLRQPQCKGAIELLDNHIGILIKECGRFWVWTPTRLALMTPRQKGKPPAVGALEILEEEPNEINDDADDEMDVMGTLVGGDAGGKRKQPSLNVGVTARVTCENLLHNMISIWTFFWIWFYYSTTGGLLQFTLYCVQMNSGGKKQFLLVMCPQLVCYDEEHQTWLNVGVVFLIAYILLMTLGVRKLVNWKRKYAIDLTHGFNTNGYDHSGSVTIYWDVVFLLRATVMNITTYYRTQDMTNPILKRTTLMMFLLVFLGMQSFFNPFDGRRQNILNTLEMYCLVVLAASVPVFEYIQKTPEATSSKVAFVVTIGLHFIFIVRCIRQLLIDIILRLEAQGYRYHYERMHSRKRKEWHKHEQNLIEARLGASVDAELDEEVHQAEAGEGEKKFEGVVGSLKKIAAAQEDVPKKNSQKLGVVNMGKMKIDELGDAGGAQALKGYKKGRKAYKVAFNKFQRLKGLGKARIKKFKDSIDLDSSSSSDSSGQQHSSSSEDSNYSGSSEIVLLEHQLPGKTRGKKLQEAKWIFQIFAASSWIPWLQDSAPGVCIMIYNCFKRLIYWAYMTVTGRSSVVWKVFKAVSAAVKSSENPPGLHAEDGGFYFVGSDGKKIKVKDTGRSVNRSSKLFSPKILLAQGLTMRHQMDVQHVVGAIERIIRSLVRGHKFHSIPLGLLEHIARNREVEFNSRGSLAHGGHRAETMDYQIQKMGAIVDAMVWAMVKINEDADFNYKLFVLNDAVEAVLGRTAKQTKVLPTRTMEFIVLGWQVSSSGELRKRISRSSWFRTKAPMMDREDGEAVESAFSSKAQIQYASELKSAGEEGEDLYSAATKFEVEGFQKTFKPPCFWDFWVASEMGMLAENSDSDAVTPTKLFERSEAVKKGVRSIRKSLTSSMESTEMRKASSQSPGLSKGLIRLKQSRTMALDMGGSGELDFDPASSMFPAAGEDELPTLTVEDIEKLANQNTFLDSRLRVALRIIPPEAAIHILDCVATACQEAQSNMRSWFAALGVATLRIKELEPFTLGDAGLEFGFRQFKLALPIIGLRGFNFVAFKMKERFERVVLRDKWERSHKEWLVGTLKEYLEHLSIRWTHQGVALLNSSEVDILREGLSTVLGIRDDFEDCVDFWSNHEPQVSDLWAWQTWNTVRRFMNSLMSLPQPQAEPDNRSLQVKKTRSLSLATASSDAKQIRPSMQRDSVFDNAQLAARMQKRASEQSLFREEDFQILDSFDPELREQAREAFLYALSEWRSRCMDWAFGAASNMLQVTPLSVTQRGNPYRVLHELGMGRADLALKPFVSRQAPSILQDNVLKDNSKIYIRSETNPQLYLASSLDDGSEAEAVVCPQDQVVTQKGHMGAWLIQKVRETGTPMIMHDDEVYLKSLYGSGSFLDAREQDIEGGAIYIVSADHPSMKSGQADRFRISNKKGYGAIKVDQEVIIANVDEGRPAYIAAEVPRRHHMRYAKDPAREQNGVFPISTTLTAPAPGDKEDVGFKGFWLLSPAESRVYDFKCYRHLFKNKEDASDASRSSGPPGLMAAVCPKGPHTFSEVEPASVGEVLTKKLLRRHHTVTWECCVCGIHEEAPKGTDELHKYDKHWCCRGCDLAFCAQCYKFLMRWDDLQAFCEKLEKLIIVECSNCKKIGDRDVLGYHCSHCGKGNFEISSTSERGKKSLPGLESLVKNNRSDLVHLLLKIDGSMEMLLMTPVGTFSGFDILHWFLAHTKQKDMGMFQNKYCKESFHQMEDLSMSLRAHTRFFTCTSCGKDKLRQGAKERIRQKQGKDFSWRKRAEKTEVAMCSYCQELYCSQCRKATSALYDVWEVIERCASMHIIEETTVCLLKCLVCSRPDAVLEVLLELEQKADWERELRPAPHLSISIRSATVHVTTMSRWVERQLRLYCTDDDMDEAFRSVNRTWRPEMLSAFSQEAQLETRIHLMHSPGAMKKTKSDLSAAGVQSVLSEERRASDLRRANSNTSVISEGRRLSTTSSITSAVDPRNAMDATDLTAEGNQFIYDNYFVPRQPEDIPRESRACGVDPEDLEILKEVTIGMRDPQSLRLNWDHKLLEPAWRQSRPQLVAWGDHKVEHARGETKVCYNYVERGCQVEIGNGTLAETQEQQAAHHAAEARSRGREIPLQTPIRKEDLYKFTIEDTRRAIQKEKAAAAHMASMQEFVQKSQAKLLEAVAISHATLEKRDPRARFKVVQILKDMEDLREQRENLARARVDLIEGNNNCEGKAEDD